MFDKLERRQQKIDEQAGRGEVDFAGIIGKLTREQMLNDVNQLLTDECYSLVPVQPIGTVTPDFHGRREGEKRVYEIVGVLCMSPDGVVPGYNQLVEMEKVLGDRAEYALAVHQMPEYLLYDILEADKGKLYIDMKERQHMMWVCYITPDGSTSTWCFLGGSRDPMLERRFSVIRQLTAEAMVGPRVTAMLMEEEDF